MTIFAAHTTRAYSLVSMNKLSLLAIILIIATANMAFVGCDFSSDSDTELSRDCLLTAVTLGSLNRTIHTTASDGSDSTYTTTVTGSLYPMYIDQINNQIYNPDSLPVGTDVSKVVFSTFSVTSYVSIKSLATAEDTTFSASDSTDFTQPRVFTVFAEDVTQKREYTVDVRVHKEEGDSTNWQTIANGTATAIASMQQMRTLCKNNEIFIFGETASKECKLIKSGIENYAFNETKDIYTSTGAPLDVMSVQYFKDKFFSLANGELVISESGEGTWQTLGVSQHFTSLIGTSTDSLFAISEGKMYSTYDGVTWKESTTDNEGLLPNSHIASTLFPSRTDDSYENMLLIGESNGEASLWLKSIDFTGNFSYSWIYLPQTEELGDYSYPLLASPNLLYYDDACLLVGITSDNEVSPFYFSRDNGRTWKEGDFDHPTFLGATALACVVDENKYLWLFISGTGSIYKVRINRLGWTEEQTRFEKVHRLQP